MVVGTSNAALVTDSWFYRYKNVTIPPDCSYLHSFSRPTPNRDNGAAPPTHVALAYLPAAWRALASSAFFSSLAASQSGSAKPEDSGGRGVTVSVSSRKGPST